MAEAMIAVVNREKVAKNNNSLLIFQLARWCFTVLTSSLKLAATLHGFLYKKL